MGEEAVRFGSNQYLMGILTFPDEPIPSLVVLLLNAGMIHHVGPSRIYVRLARRLAAQGMTVLRFDFSGLGDSCARTDSLAIDKALVDDVRQAMNYLDERLEISKFVLMGHCGGAWVAFLAASEDDRVVGAVLMNPEGVENNWVEYDRQRKTSHYYENYYTNDVLLDSQRWKRLLSGKADYRSIFNNIIKNIAWYKISAAAFKLRHQIVASDDSQERQIESGRWVQIASTFLRRRTQLLLAFSKGSSAIDHAHAVIGKELHKMQDAGIVTEVIISNADHTFTLIEGQQSLMHHIEDWCRPLMGEPSQEPSS